MNVFGRPLLQSFVRRDDGATAIEYALIAGFISIVILGGVVALSGGVLNLYNSISNAVS